MESQEQQVKFEQWCIVELYGRNRIVGLVSEKTIGGMAFIRVDVPEVVRDAERYENGERLKYQETIPAFTKFFGQGAIYAMTPVSEEIGRAMAKQRADRPISAFELPKLKELESPSKDDDEDF